MRQKTNQKRQKKIAHIELLPKKTDFLKGIDFRKYRVASPSELTSDPIKDNEQAKSTSASMDGINVGMGFGSITEI